MCRHGVATPAERRDRCVTIAAVIANGEAGRRDDDADRRHPVVVVECGERHPEHVIRRGRMIVQAYEADVGPAIAGSAREHERETDQVEEPSQPRYHRHQYTGIQYNTCDGSSVSCQGRARVRVDQERVDDRDPGRKNLVVRLGQELLIANRI